MGNIFIAEMCSKSLRVVWVLLVLCQFVQSYPFTVKELDLPPYLRGIQWYNVQEELMWVSIYIFVIRELLHYRKDFRLDPTVLPIFYDIHLDISVKGYNGANRSTFDGSYSTLSSATSQSSQDTFQLLLMFLSQKIRLNCIPSTWRSQRFG